MRLLDHRISEQTALVESDIARRRADQAADGVTLHVFAHVEAHQFNPQALRQLARDLGLADAGGPGEQEVADGLVRIAQPRARQLDAGRQLLDRRILPVDDQFEVTLQGGELVAVVGGNALGRNARDLGDGLLDVAHLHRFAPLGLGQQAQPGRGLVDDVDGLVGQLPVGDVPRRQFHRRAQGAAGVLHGMVLFEARLQPFEDFHGVLDTGLVDIDLLETPRQGTVLFEDAAVLLIGGRADAAQFARRQQRLEQVGGVHHPAGRRTGTDDHVDFVDENDGARLLLELVHHRLESLLEVTAVLGAGDQRAQVEAVDHAAFEQLGYLVFHDQPGQALGDGGLAHPRLADQQRIVLATPAQGLHHALDLEVTADQRVDPAFCGALVEVDRVLLEGRALIPLVLAPALGARFTGVGRLVGHRAILGDAVRHEVDDVEPRHALFAEQIHRMSVLLGKQGDQHVERGHLLLARGLDVVDRALQHPLE